MGLICHVGYEFELLTLYHHSAKLGGHRHCDSGDIFNLALDCMFIALCKFMDGSHSQ